MAAATRILPIVLLLAASSVISACDHEDDDSNGGGPITEGPPTAGGGEEEPVATSWTFDASQCPSAYPIPMTVSTEIDAERAYVQNVVTCTSDAQYGPVWLHNVGDEIWQFDRGTAEVEFVEYTDESDMFAEIFDDPPILVPDDVLVIHAPPSRVSWTLDAGYTIAWETQAEAIEQLEGYSEEAVFLAVKRKSSPQRAALAACTLTGYNAASEWTDDPDGFGENLGAALSSGAGAAGCATKWESTWSKRFAPTAQFIDDADSIFGVLSRLGRVAIMIKG